MTMTVIDFLLLLLVAGICGSIGQTLVGYTRGGCVASVALGLIGALLGFWLSDALGLPDILVVQIGEQPFPVVWSIAGSALFVAIISLLSRSRGRRW